jgi:hypothetical protein
VSLVAGWRHLAVLRRIPKIARGNRLWPDRDPQPLLAGPVSRAIEPNSLDPDPLDPVQVQIAAKYPTGPAATWREGDWNSARAAGNHLG